MWTTSSLYSTAATQWLGTWPVQCPPGLQRSAPSLRTRRTTCPCTSSSPRCPPVAHCMRHHRTSGRMAQTPSTHRYQSRSMSCLSGSAMRYPGSCTCRPPTSSLPRAAGERPPTRSRSPPAGTCLSLDKWLSAARRTLSRPPPLLVAQMLGSSPATSTRQLPRGRPLDGVFSTGTSTVRTRCSTSTLRRTVTGQSGTLKRRQGSTTFRSLQPHMGEPCDSPLRALTATSRV
mmetsp:Transcript_3760/g.11938  ORF Transcript_3760/g.11938 Transcript_3760/m.11938 type:complete len:231 (-) Transcript_3760:630-1322(-)